MDEVHRQRTRLEFSSVRLIFLQNIIEEQCHHSSKDEGQGLVSDFNKTFGYHIPDEGTGDDP